MLHTIGDTHTYVNALKAKDDFYKLTKKNDYQTGSKLKRCIAIVACAAKGYVKDAAEPLVSPLTLVQAGSNPERANRRIERLLGGDEACGLIAKKFNQKPGKGRCEGDLSYSRQFPYSDRAKEYADDLYDNFCNFEDKKLINRLIPYRTSTIMALAEKHSDFFNDLKVKNPKYNGQEFKSEDEPVDYYQLAMLAPVEIKVYHAEGRKYEHYKTIIIDADDKKECKDKINSLQKEYRRMRSQNGLNSGLTGFKMKFKFKLQLQKDIMKELVDHHSGTFNDMVNSALDMDDNIPNEITNKIREFRGPYILNREIHTGK
ncbi:MAG: hypothetical protein GY874_14995 [Desulfobacteraceae bacterium]|nr:hypothetical protein [Desulfobacteraceae bacterium]